tara:strand:+ start:515 stop:2302 length:1788 start_codon:yes stop_codon:yes gene_type:complete
MDKNTIIGFLLLSLVIFGYYSIYPPQNPQTNLEDEIIQQKNIINEKIIDQKENINNKNEIIELTQDTIDEKIYSIENNLIKLNISNDGGYINSVEIKKFKTYDQKKLILFDKDSSYFNIKLFTNNGTINSKEIFFKSLENKVIVEKDRKESLILKFEISENQYLEFIYSLKDNSYLVDFDINFNGFENIIAQNQNYIDVEWKINYLSTEKSIDNQRMYSTIYYKDDEVNKINERKNGTKTPKKHLKWIGFKNQFFSSILISPNKLSKPITLNTNSSKKSNKYVKELTASFTLPYSHKKIENQNLQFYFGPNNYKLLKSFEQSFEKMIPLGWGIFGIVNKALVIPCFNFLSSFISNYGIIILILTFLIKMVLFPLTFKSYVSQLKMKLIKPDIDAINEQYKEKEPMKAQQETMKLYSKSGVSPFGGCLPMLVQFPILIALFRFFPASIELRQQKFLWADDLSSYDSIASLPFEIPFYGDHVSLFTLLMTVSTIIYTKMNSQMTGASNQMPQMKIMMYMMPIMFLGFFNNYAAALSYYYFIFNIMTFGQQFLIKKYMIKESDLLKQIEEKRKKPQKKSGFMKRLEEAQRQQRMKMKK